jgi:myo-inositol-1(or 4)-monophosphatase
MNIVYSKQSLPNYQSLFSVKSRIMQYQSFVTNVLEQAANIAKEQFGKVKTSTKTNDNNQVLTETDLQVGELLVQKIQEKYPSFNIIDEEAGVINHQSEFTWVIDPIDGTSNFANGIPTYGILLGLLQNGNPLAGGMVLPSFDEIYYAEKNQGAYLNQQRIQVTKSDKLLDNLLAYGIDGHQENPQLTIQECDLLAQIILKIRNLRTSNSAYDFAMVAKGAYGAYLNQTSKIWDNVAPQIIIEEAGGIYTDFKGQALDYSNPPTRVEQNFNMLACASGLHQQILEIIKN